MNKEEFTPEQSLMVIHTMISRTRQNFSDNSIYFLVWGWLTFLACITQYLLKHVYHYEKHYMVWLVLVIGIVFSIYQGRREARTNKVKTYLDESMGHLWSGMAISFFVLGMILTKIGWTSAIFPFYIMLYGLGTFVSGCILRFRPLITGGIAAWVLAVASTFVHYDFQMLFGAVAILVSYIIPAYMLRRKMKMESAAD